MTAVAPAVIIVHGLWTGCWAMAYLGRQLAGRGLRVFRFGYPSVRGTLAGNAAALAGFAAALAAPRLHFVGHSLGGIVVFAALAGGAKLPEGRVVMLGTPLAGSLAARRLARRTAGRALLGASIGDWLARPSGAWTLPRELGIIAGSGGIGLGRLVAPGLPRPHDGAISVAETRIDGAREHRVLPVSHSQMLLSPQVARCTANFLLGGSFRGEGQAQ